MTQARDDFITRRFTRWLDRFQPRRALEGKPQALTDEIRALARILLRAAPKQEYEEWLEDALDRLDGTMRTSAWPTTGQLATVVDELQQARAKVAGVGKKPSEWSPDEVRITEERILAGEAVSEHWLYGYGADELLAGGRVAADDLDRYRKGAQSQREDVYEGAKRRRSGARSQGREVLRRKTG